MAVREFQADFASGVVNGTTVTSRPDAVVATGIATAPGPIAVGNVASGLLAKAWYIRLDAVAEEVYLCPAMDDVVDGWDAEALLFTFTGAAIDCISLAFDAAGYPVVAMERAGNIWVRYWNGASYTLTDLGAGTSPTIVHQDPDSQAWRMVHLLYERANSVYDRTSDDDYASEQSTLTVLGANQHVERAILDSNNLVHLILSTRNRRTGKYTLSRLTSVADPICLSPSGYSERIDDGVDTIFVFTGDGTITATCELTLDALLIGSGGSNGTPASVAAGGDAMRNGDPTTLWSSLDGLGLDPDVDVAPAGHIAGGGGAGGYDDVAGWTGACGGGGGAQSPSNNTMWSPGGLGQQGGRGGAGRSSWGLLPTKTAFAGGGGGLSAHGGPGTEDGGGRGGEGIQLLEWSYKTRRGGDGGWMKKTDDTHTGPIRGGNGAGGFRTIDGLIIQPGQTVRLTVGDFAAVRIRRTETSGLPDAIVSGGTAYADATGLFQLNVFTADDTLVVTTPGRAEVYAVGAGGGGGSGCGGGGGGGDVRKVEVSLTANVAVVIGAGGAGGVGGAAGANGGDTSLGAMVVSKGGGGGAGAPPSAALSRASGGGGHGDNGEGAAGSVLRAHAGGDGKGFALSAGGNSLSAGGGGGAGSEGEIGAEIETLGDELSVDWELPGTFALIPAGQHLLMDSTPSTVRAMLNKNVSAQAMFVQSVQNVSLSQTLLGPMVRAEHPTGDGEDIPTGVYAAYSYFGYKFFLGTLEGSTWPLRYNNHTIQIYAADDLQEASFHETGNLASLLTLSAADAAFNGLARSFGIMCQHTPASNFSQGYCYELMGYKSKYLEVGNVPAGGSVEVLDETDTVVASAAESSGTALVDLSLHGGCTLPVPFNGFAAILVKDSGGTVVASVTGAINPGAEFDVDGLDVTIRVDISGSEPVLIDGILAGTTFDELTPGHEYGDGGGGYEIESAWSAAFPDMIVGGGGGGGAEMVIAGAGMDGGGDGGVDTTPPTAGAANRGGGGGGSGDTTIAGGAGGSGVVVVRTSISPHLPLSGLIFNGDAEEEAGYVDGDSMTRVVDQSGNAAHLDLFAGTAPLYRDGVTGANINGHPAVHFNAADMRHITALLAGLTGGEVFAVLKNDAVAGQGLWRYSDSDQAIWHPYVNANFYESWGSNIRILIGIPATAPTLAHLYNVSAVPNDWTIRVNNTQLFNTTTGLTVTFLQNANEATFGVSGDAGGGTYYQGLLGQLVIYDHKLSTADRAALVMWLNAKWELGL